MAKHNKRIKKSRYAERDYTVAMLPHTRREVFFDVLKLQWKRFLLYGLLLLAFTLPLHAVCIMQELLIGEVMGNASLTDIEKIVQSLTVKNQMALYLIPCIMLISVAISGFSRVIRQHAWGENVFFGADFFKGIKANGLQILITGTLVGVIYAFGVFGSNYATMELINADGNGSFLMSVVYNIPMLLAILVGIPLMAYMVVVISIYKNKYLHVIVTSLMLMLKKPFWTVIALICCLAPFAIQLIPNIIVIVLARLVTTLLSPFIYLAWQLFVLNKLDKQINKEHYPELVGRGTYPMEILFNDNTDNKEA